MCIDAKKEAERLSLIKAEWDIVMQVAGAEGK